MLEKVQSCMTIPSKLFDRPRTDVRYKLLYPVRSADADPSDNPRWFARPDKPTKHQKVDNIFESFVAKLEEHLNCKRQLFNMDELWSKTHPESMDANLSKATGTIYQKLVYSATANDVVKPFIAKYQAAHEGRTPYLEPIFKRRYEYGTSVTKAEVEKTVQQFETFRSWLLNVLFKSDPDEITILLFPQTWGIPSYRDEGKPPKKDIFWEAFSLYSISYVSGCPDITVPVGQVPYHSRITEHEEWLPVSLSFLSQPGNDRVLTSLLRQLEGTGVLSPIQEPKLMQTKQRYGPESAKYKGIWPS
jgi:Asp-tRNA(Asn)/Glu-tRNA(Gln) amidotransferase A subunit family amidase